MSLLAFWQIISYHPMVFSTCNNKEDILTQSQMFKATYCPNFIACQHDKINGIKKFDVMDIKHISTLSSKGKIIKFYMELQT